MGYVNKQETTEKLVEALRRVVAGEVVLSDKMTRRLLQNVVGGKASEQNPVESLSNRELEVFEMIGRRAHDEANCRPARPESQDGGGSPREDQEQAGPLERRSIEPSGLSVGLRESKVSAGFAKKAEWRRSDAITQSEATGRARPAFPQRRWHGRLQSSRSRSRASR